MGGEVQREEEGESTEVHVPLRIKFTSLYVWTVGFADRCFDAGRTFFGDAPDAVTRIDEEEKDEHECNFQTVLDFRDLSIRKKITSFESTIGEVEMKWKSWRRQAEGSGKMSRQNTAISNTRRAKT